jgi:hypothetical protein
MFRTKKDVDKHVQDIYSKIISSSERNLKGYSIAKLYFGVRFSLAYSMKYYIPGSRLRIMRMPGGILLPTWGRWIPVR